MPTHLGVVLSVDSLTPGDKGKSGFLGRHVVKDVDECPLTKGFGLEIHANTKMSSSIT